MCAKRRCPSTTILLIAPVCLLVKHEFHVPVSFSRTKKNPALHCCRIKRPVLDLWHNGSYARTAEAACTLGLHALSTFPTHHKIICLPTYAQETACLRRPVPFQPTVHHTSQDPTKYLSAALRTACWTCTETSCLEYGTAVHHPEAVAARMRRRQQAAAYCAAGDELAPQLPRTSLSHYLTAPTAQFSAHTCSAESGGWYPSARRLPWSSERSSACGAAGRVAKTIQKRVAMCSAQSLNMLPIRFAVLTSSDHHASRNKPRRRRLIRQMRPQARMRCSERRGQPFRLPARSFELQCLPLAERSE